MSMGSWVRLGMTAALSLLLGPGPASAQLFEGFDAGKLEGALRDVGADQVVGSAVQAFKDPRVGEDAIQAVGVAEDLATRQDLRRSLEAVGRNSPRLMEVLKNTDPEKVKEILDKVDPDKIDKALDALERFERWGSRLPEGLAAMLGAVALLALARCQVKRQLTRWRKQKQPCLLGGGGPSVELAAEEGRSEVVQEADESQHFRAF